MQLDRESPGAQTWNEGDVEQSADPLNSTSSVAFVGLAIGLSLVVSGALVEPANAVSKCCLLGPPPCSCGHAGLGVRL
jgi:hypothetical protein